MKINKISLRYLRNDTHFQFHTEFKDLAQKHDPQALKVKPQYDAYLPLYDKVDLALKKINKSAITEKIQDADKARDEIWGIWLRQTPPPLGILTRPCGRRQSSLK